MRARAADRDREDLIIAVSTLDARFQMPSVTQPESVQGHPGPGKKGMMMMIMVMATCKVRNPAEHNLNGFGMPQHVESHVKMQTQTTAVKQNSVQLLLPPYYIMHG